MFIIIPGLVGVKTRSLIFYRIDIVLSGLVVTPRSDKRHTRSEATIFIEMLHHGLRIEPLAYGHTLAT